MPRQHVVDVYKCEFPKAPPPSKVFRECFLPGNWKQGKYGVAAALAGCLSLGGVW